MKKPLLITGSHPDVVADMLAVPCREIEYDLMAIGLDAVDKYLWPVLYVATFHPAEIAEIKDRRAGVGGEHGYKVISHEHRPEVDIFIADWWKPTGSSALLGAQAALTVLGYERIILCGCPLTGMNGKGNNYETFRRGWETNRGKVIGKVTSMSGWTAELLGKPTEEWVRG
jgi:hypothetical protein